MKKIAYLLICFCCLAKYDVQATIRYVKALGTGNGSSWSNASNDLQLMIDSSNAGDEVWVAGGNYKPIRPDTNTSVISINNRNNAFVMKAGVKVYGGYFGSGAFANLRLPQSYITELDGDIGTANTTSDNAYHVVLILGADSCLLDGFTLKNANANGSATAIAVNGFQIGNNINSGIYAVQSSGIKIANCIVTNNIGTSGTVGFEGTTGSVEHLNMINNNTSGGHLNIGVSYLSVSTLMQSDVTFRYCQIAGNTSDFGTVNITGGCSSKFYSSTFAGNSITLNYGTSIINGMITLHGNSSIYGTPNTAFINCSISGNKYDVAHVSSIYCDTVTSFAFKNSIVWGDANSTFPVITGSGIYDIKRSITQGQAALFNFLIPSGNIDVDPQFANQPSYTMAPFTTGDYHLGNCSPAINTGNNSYLTSYDLNDISGNKRIVGGKVDIGAYEFALGTPDANGIVYVDSSTTSDGVGNSWANAIPELADALKAAQYDTSIHEIRVAHGTYKPLYTADSLLCNTNNNRKKSFVIPDGVSIIGGYVNGAITYTNGFPQNPSILSGDIGIANNTNDNAYHVVIAAGTNNNNTKIYNFIIEKGCTDATAPSITVNGIIISGIMGSGMANQANAQGSISNKGADILYCTFKNNIGYYGAISNAYCNNALVFGTKVIRDSAVSGGGITNLGPGTVHIHHSRISGNKAAVEGGGIFTRKCNVYIYNSLITGNYTNGTGGGIKSDSSVTTIGNCTVASNKSAYNFGGYDHSNTGGTQTATITNSIFWGNDANTYKNFDTSNNPLISVTNCITGTEKYNYGIDVRDNTPMFMNPVLAQNAPVDTGDYHLSICSPAINAGNNNYTPSPYYSDMDGGQRVAQSIIDLGPYETSGRTISQTPGDSVGNTNFLNGCYFTEYIAAANGKVWGNIINTNDKLITSYNEVNGIGTALSSALYPVVFYSKLTIQYGTGNTLQLANPFGQTGYYYPMNRSWTFTANGIIASPVRLRLYFDATDSIDLASQTNFGTSQNLIVYKVNGTSAYNTTATGYKEYTYATTADTNHFSLGTYQGIHYAEIEVTSFSSFGIAFKTSTPLVIQLKDISATNIDKRNRIDWNTINEAETSKFFVERSNDGKEFTMLAAIAANGYTSSYTYWDETPFSGMNYYRLRVQDIRGHESYTKIVQVFLNDDNRFYLDIFPNPATDQLKIKLMCKAQNNAQISITDRSGRLILKQIFSQQEMTLNLSKFTSGIYLLHYQDDIHQETRKIIKK